MEAERKAGAVAEPELVAAARTLCEQADQEGVHARLLGGIAIWLRASEPSRSMLGRDYADIDLVTSKRHARGLREVLERCGYLPNKMFNATQGDTRLYYQAPDGGHHVDVFIERFVMSHELALGSRLPVEPLTLPAADLLLTKLQIAELNRKDASDAVMLLMDHELEEHDGERLLNVRYICDLCASNWGLYTTVTDNLDKTAALLDEITPAGSARELVGARIARLRTQLEQAPKSGGWRRRAKIGRRVRWYQTPDEATR